MFPKPSLNERLKPFTAAAGQIDAARFTATATALPDGRALILGGYDPEIVVSAGAWLYAP